MAKSVMCRECGGRFNKELLKENEDWIMPSKNWYYHKDCYEAWVTKRSDKKNISSIKNDEEYIRDIFDYLSRDLKVSYDGGKVRSQINNFIKQGKKAKGILFSLIYFYDIQNGDWNNSNGGIGIVPYIYDDARAYWSEQKERQNDVLEKIEKQMRERRERETITIKRKKETKRWKSHIEEIGEFEDEQ